MDGEPDGIGSTPTQGTASLHFSARANHDAADFVNRKMRTLYLAAILPFVTGAAADEGRITWQHKGYTSLFDAAVAAQKSGRRILVGVSGPPGRDTGAG